MLIPYNKIDYIIMVIVQSLWVGNSLSNMEVCCIKSFLKHGFTFHLYTYESVKEFQREQ